MEVKIYVDVLLLVNLMFDYLLLYITSLILRLEVKNIRLFLAALPGALYGVLAFFLPLYFVSCLPLKIGVGALMILIAYRPGSLRVYAQEVCVFFVVSLMCGGAAFALFYFSDAAALLGAVYRNGSIYVNIPISLLLLLALVCYLLLRVTCFCGARLAVRHKNIVTLEVRYKEKKLALHGFYDSGNLLREKISGKGVIVAEWEKGKHLFPGCKSPEDAAKDGLLPIPYRTLQGESLIYAFLPDALYRRQNNKLIPTETVYIGLIDQTLDFYHNWDAILPHDFEGENQNETKLYPNTTDNLCASETKDITLVVR